MSKLRQKIATGIYEGALSAIDKYKQEFDPKTYYHVSRSPDIQKFVPTASTARSVFAMPEQRRKNLGAVYFTKDYNFIDQMDRGISSEWEDAVRTLSYEDPDPSIRKQLKDEIAEFTKRRADARYIENDLVDAKDLVYGNDMINYIKNHYGSEEEAIEEIAENYREANKAVQRIEEISGLQMPTGTTVYPVKIKTKDLFDGDNEEDLDVFDNFLYGRDVDAMLEKIAEVTNTPIDYVNIEKYLKQWRVLEIPEVQQVLKDAGYRGYFTNEPGTAALFYPDEGDVRSVYAKFNPEDKKSGNIMASVAGSIGVGGALGGINGQSSD
jgi:hypothetical protein